MKLLESRAVRLMLVWLLASVAGKGLMWLAAWAGLPPAAVADLSAYLAKLQTDAWVLVLAMIGKWGAEDFAKWLPLPRPDAPPVAPQPPVVVAPVITNNAAEAPKGDTNGSDRK